MQHGQRRIAIQGHVGKVEPARACPIGGQELVSLVNRADE